jgi:hypothetical protein
MIADSGLPGRKLHLTIAFLVLVFVGLAILRWPVHPPVGTDCDEHLIVARTFVRTGHFSVADVHSTKYPPLLSSLAILLGFTGLDVQMSLLAVNYLLVLAAALLMYSLLLRQVKIGALAVLPILYLMSNPILWVSASTIIADSFLFLFVTGALVLALTTEEWTPRRTLFAAVLALLATMSRSIGLVAIVPLAAAMVSDHRRRGDPFPSGKLALLVGLPLCTLLLHMAYQARFGPHVTGYLETFRLLDPFDASKGVMTVPTFLGRTLRGCFDSIRDLRNLMVFPTCAGLVSYGVALALLIVALGKDKKRIVVVSSFVLAYMAISCLWPYKGARFVLPLLTVATLGVGRGLELSLHSRNRLVGGVFLLLLLAHLAANGVTLRTEAGVERQSRSFMNVQIGLMIDWCKANIPDDETIASFDYRVLIFRLDRPVVPLGYDSRPAVHITEMREHDVEWLVVCRHIFPPRATYADSILQVLGERATMTYRNETAEVYRVDLRPRPSPAGQSSPPAGR